MKPRRLLTSALAIALCAAMAVPLTASASAEAVPTPQNDAFYKQPSPFPDVPNGTILNHRPVTITGFGIPLPVRSWQVQYATRDTRNQPQATVATIIRPLTDNAQPKLLSYQAAIDSLSPTCRPSYGLRIGLQTETALMALGLLNGWTLVTSDFEGPDDAFTAGIQAGHATLDGIRAAERFAPAGLPGTTTPVGMMGYSGGSQATEFAAELAPSYAPELNIKGVAAGGLPVNIGNIAKKINGGPFAGIYFAAALGISRAYPEIPIATLLNAKGKAMAERIKDECIASYVPRYAYRNLNDYTTIGDPLTLPVIQKVIEEDAMGHHLPKAPLFFYHSTNDELAPIEDVDALVKKYCSAGATLNYHRSVLSGHITLAATGAPTAIRYLRDRFADKPAPTTC